MHSCVSMCIHMYPYINIYIYPCMYFCFPSVSDGRQHQPHKFDINDAHCNGGKKYKTRQLQRQPLVVSDAQRVVRRVLLRVNDHI